METDIERNEKRSKGKARSATLEDEEDRKKRTAGLSEDEASFRCPSNNRQRL